MKNKRSMIGLIVLVVLLVGVGFFGISYLMQRSGIKQGVDYLNQKEYQKAYESFERASSKPSMIWTKQKTDVYYYKGEALYKLERYENAVSVYNSIIEHDKQGKAYAMKALCYAGLKKEEQALTICDQGIKEVKTDGDCYDVKIGLLVKSQDYSEALDVVSLALKNQITSCKADIMFSRISLYEAKLDYNSAYKYAKEYVKAYPKDKKGKKEVTFLSTRI